MPLVFITGPVRCGKSAFAAKLAEQTQREVTYVATAQDDPEDAEWRARLSRHLHDRPSDWRTVETARMTHASQLALFAAAAPQQCLLVDALGTWLAARIGQEKELLEVDYAVLETRLDREAAEMADALLASPAYVIVVSEQIGWDVVPVAASARLFRDSLGRMAQRVARNAQRAYLVVAGYAIDLRATARPV